MTDPLTIRTTEDTPTARLYRDPDDPRRVVLEVHTAERVDRQVLHAGDLAAALAPEVVGAGQITTPEELYALPVGSVVINPFDNAEFHKTRSGRWVDAGGSRWLASEMVQDDQEYVLYRPDAPAPSAETHEDREALGRLLWEQRGGSLRPGSWDDTTLFTEEVRESWRREADEILAWFATRQPAPVDAETLGEVAGGLLIRCATTAGHTMTRTEADRALATVWQSGYVAGVSRG